MPPLTSCFLSQVSSSQSSNDYNIIRSIHDAEEMPQPVNQGAIDLTEAKNCQVEDFANCVKLILYCMFHIFKIICSLLSSYFCLTHEQGGVPQKPLKLTIQRTKKKLPVCVLTFKFLRCCLESSFYLLLFVSGIVITVFK